MFKKEQQPIVVLVAGIFSLIVCQPVGVIAWVMSQKALNEMKAAGVDSQDPDLARVKAARTMAIVATFLAIGYALAWVFFVRYQSTLNS